MAQRPMMWYCSDCKFETSSMDNALEHPWGDDPDTFTHVLYLREHLTAPAVKSMHSSDSGGCYVDSMPNDGGMLRNDPYKVKKIAV